LRKQSKEIDAQLAEQALADQELEKIYQSVPGIGVGHEKNNSNAALTCS
jgi:hypothetical protein